MNHKMKAYRFLRKDLTLPASDAWAMAKALEVQVNDIAEAFAVVMGTAEDLFAILVDAVTEAVRLFEEELLPMWLNIFSRMFLVDGSLRKFKQPVYPELEQRRVLLNRPPVWNRRIAPRPYAGNNYKKMRNN